MTGYDVIKRAMHLLGYSGDAGDPSELGSTSVKGFEIIKQLLIDLKCSDISSLSEAFDISHLDWVDATDDFERIKKSLTITGWHNGEKYTREIYVWDTWREIVEDYMSEKYNVR